MVVEALTTLLGGLVEHWVEATLQDEIGLLALVDRE